MIFVRDLLGLDSFKEMELMTGNAGLNRKVSWPNIAQTESIREWLVGGDVILMSGVGLAVTDSLLNDIVQQAVDGEAACMIMLKNPSHIPEIPQSTIELARANSFPLFAAPWNTMLSHVIRDISQLEVNDKYIESARNEFWDSVLTGSVNLSLPVYRDIVRKYSLDDEGRVIIIRGGRCDQAYRDEDYKKAAARRAVFFDVYNAFQKYQHIRFYIYGNNQMIFVVGTEMEEAEIAGVLTDILQRYRGMTLRAGISKKRKGVKSLEKSYHEARMASMVQAEKPVVFYSELGIYRLLMEIPDQNLIRNYVDEQLGAIRAYDEKNQQALLETLRVFLQCNGNLAEAAQRMFVHRNTLIKRIRKIEELTGRSLKSPEVRNLYYDCFVLDEYTCERGE